MRFRRFSQMCTASIATLRFPGWATVFWQAPAAVPSSCLTSYGRGSKTGRRQDKLPSRSQTCGESCKTASSAHIRKRPFLTRSARPRKHDVGRAGIRAAAVAPGPSTAATRGLIWVDDDHGDKLNLRSLPTSRAALNRVQFDFWEKPFAKNRM